MIVLEPTFLEGEVSNGSLHTSSVVKVKQNPNPGLLQISKEFAYKKKKKKCIFSGFLMVEI